MASKQVEFDGVRFGVSTFEAAIKLIEELSSDPIRFIDMSVDVGSATWTLDTVHEFYAKLRGEHKGSTIITGSSGTSGLTFSARYYKVFAKHIVTVSDKSIAVIERVMEVFESAAPESVFPPLSIPTVSPPTVFIGHGGGSQEWRELEQYLRNHMGYKTEAYETEPRGGDDIQRILDQMFARSDFALLVMSAEDQQPDGTLRGRQNVVHETGLAQGLLGWKKAVVLLENGAEDYSNLAGVQQIRFDKGAISAAFGSVAATLKHELGK